MTKILTVDKALELLGEANKLNPGQWYEHSLVVGHVSGKIAEALNLDSDKAMAFGYIHDIGRRVGRCGLKHIYEGYKYLNKDGYLCMEIGYNQKQKVEELLKQNEKYTSIYTIKDSIIRYLCLRACF